MKLATALALLALLATLGAAKAGEIRVRRRVPAGVKRPSRVCGSAGSRPPCTSLFSIVID